MATTSSSSSGSSGSGSSSSSSDVERQVSSAAEQFTRAYTACTPVAQTMSDNRTCAMVIASVLAVLIVGATFTVGYFSAYTE